MPPIRPHREKIPEVALAFSCYPLTILILFSVELFYVHSVKHDAQMQQLASSSPPPIQCVQQ